MPFEELEFHAISYVGMIGDDLHIEVQSFHRLTFLF